MVCFLFLITTCTINTYNTRKYTNVGNFKRYIIITFKCYPGTVALLVLVRVLVPAFPLVYYFANFLS